MAVVISTFDTSADGWTLQGDVASDSWQSSGGDPGGFFQWVDAATGSDSYFIAPSKFLGSQSVMYGGVLTYNLQDTGDNYSGVPDVELTGDGITLDFSNAGTPGITPAWGQFAANLKATGWTVSGSNAAATAAQMQSVLGDLTQMLIRGEYVSGNETGGIDNVEFNSTGGGATNVSSDIWNGNGNWTTDTGDWSLGSPPTSSTDALIQTGTVTLNAAGVAQNVVIDNNATQTLFVTGASATLTAASLVAYGNFDVDTNGGDGGSAVNISGAFANWSNAVIGNSSLASNVTVTVGGFGNYGGYGNLNMWGNETLGTTHQATLIVNAAAPTTLTGKYYIHGDSLIQYKSGGIQTIASGAELQLDGQQARMSIGAGTTNSALSGLSYNYGTFDEEGDWQTGPGGSTVTTTTNFFNGGTFQLDVYGNDGASQMTIGGTLTNTGGVTLGNTSLSALTTLTVGNLVNQGTINLWGNETLGTSEQVTLNDLAAAPATWTGQIYIHGDSDVIFKSGGITSIASGAEIQIDGQQARYSIGAGTTNSALSGLATNYGTFDEEGDWQTGPGGATVTTNAAFTNYSLFYLDYYNNDGASKFTETGLFTNDDYLQIGNDSLSANTTLTTGSLVNNGTLYLDSQRNGGTGQPQAALDVLSAAPSASTGFLRVAGNSLIDFQSGAIQSIVYGGEIELDGGAASIAIGSSGSNSALTTLSSNAGTLLLRGNNGFGAGVTLTTSTGYTNTGVTRIDYYNGDGGDNVTFGGPLVNQSELDIGNQYLSAATTVSATSLTNTGSLTLQGNTAGTGSSMAKLAISGPAPASVSNSYRIGGNATLNFGSGTGFTSVLYGGYLELDASLANVSIGAGAQNSGLANLASNAGTFVLRGNQYGSGGVTLATGGAFSNTGTVYLDYYNGDGGDQVTFGGGLSNSATFDIGNQYLAATTTVQATSFKNTGSLTIQGSVGGSTSPMASLAITGSSIANVTNYIRIAGNGTLSFASGAGFQSVLAGATLELDAALANVKIGASGAQNSGLMALALNQGSFVLRGNVYGAGGVKLTTATQFTNSGTTYIDYYNGDGGSTVTFGGTLKNSGTFNIGNQYLAAATVVNATTVANTGSLTLQGSSSASGAAATLNISGQASGTVTNSIRISGVAKLDFGSGGGYAVIATGGYLELDSASANLAIGAGAQNSGLAGLGKNSGTLLLRGNVAGAGGVTLTTTVAYNNLGTTLIDYYNGDGGDAVTFGGQLTNQGSMSIGNGYLAATTQVTAAGLNNNGSLTLQGSFSSTGPAALLTLTGSSLSAERGFIRVGGTATFSVGTGSGFTGIAQGGFLELDSAQANVTVSGGAQNSGLANLSSNAGTLLLRGNSNFGGGGVTVTTSGVYVNSGTTELDYYGGDGASKLTVSGLLNNQGTFDLGNNNLSAADSVTANNLQNNAGQINIYGNSSNTATMSITLNAMNYAGVEVGGGGVLAVSKTYTQYAGLTQIDGTLSASAYIQYGGSTTVNGNLAVANVQESGGGMTFNAALTASSTLTKLSLQGGAFALFNAGVSSSQTLAFLDGTDLVNLATPTTFAGNVTGFVGGDAIDLLHQSNAANVSYSGGVLSVLDGGSNVLESFKLSGGSYTSSSFSLVDDLNGGKLLYV